MSKSSLRSRVYNRLKRKLKSTIISRNRWITPVSEQVACMQAEDPEYFAWLMKNKLYDSFQMLMKSEAAETDLPSFSVVIPVYNTPPDLLEKAVNSVFKQLYSVWEIVICDDSSDNEETLRSLENLLNDSDAESSEKFSSSGHAQSCKKDIDVSVDNRPEFIPGRIKLLKNDVNMGISVSTNRCAEHSAGDYIVFLDHDDELYPDALLKTGESIKKNPDASIFYSDEDYLSEEGYRHSYNFKPGFSPSLLETHNYILHMVCVKRAVFIKAGGLRKEFDGSQDYDFLLRLMDMKEKFVHIPDILYSWRENATSMIGGMLKPAIFSRGKRALEDHFKRSGDSIEYVKDSLDNIKGIYRTRFSMPENLSIAVVQIGKRDFRFNLYDVEPNICLRKIVWDPVDPFPDEFYSLPEDVVIFLDCNLAPVSWPEFIRETVPVALRKDIGAVGVPICSGDGIIVSAGRSLMPWGVLRNDFRGVDAGVKYSPAARLRDLFSVSGAVLVISASNLKDVLCEGSPDVVFWDLDISIRLNRKGRRVVLIPYSSMSYKVAFDQCGGSGSFDVKYIIDRYNIKDDPYLNINLIDQKRKLVNSSSEIGLPRHFSVKQAGLNDEDLVKTEEVEKKEKDFYHRWLSFHSPDLKKSDTRVAAMKYRPFFSIIMPTYNSELAFFKELMKSLKAQTYRDFELCISDDASTSGEFIDFLQQLESGNSDEAPDKVKIIRSDTNNGIAGNTNRAISIASGAWLVLCDHDDLVEPFALEMIAEYINDHPDVGVLYSDEDMIDQKGWRHSPRLQPDWNPDMLMSHMYCPHMVSFRRDMLDMAGLFNPEMDGAQDYDFFLRITEKSSRVGHIPMILYSWRSVYGSVAFDACAKIYAYDAGKRALEAAVKRRNEDAVVLKASGTKLGVYRVRRKVPSSSTFTHIVEAGSEFLLSMINNIINIASVKPEIVVVCRHRDENSLKSINHISGIKVIMCDNNLNRADIYNMGADASDGEHLVFSSRFIDLLDSDYPFGLLEHTQREEIGAAGGKIIYPNGFFYHTGMLLGVNGVAGYAHRNIEQCPGYWHFASCIRNYSAVSWDLMSVSKAKFFQVDGFDSTFTQFGDVDFCLKLIEKGYRNIYTPYVAAVLNRPVHFLEELRNTGEEKILLERYGDLIRNDSMHHPLMSKTLEDFSIDL